MILLTPLLKTLSVQWGLSLLTGQNSNIPQPCVKSENSVQCSLIDILCLVLSRFTLGTHSLVFIHQRFTRIPMQIYKALYLHSVLLSGTPSILQIVPDALASSISDLYFLNSAKLPHLLEFFPPDTRKCHQAESLGNFRFTYLLPFSQTLHSFLCSTSLWKFRYQLLLHGKKLKSSMQLPKAKTSFCVLDPIFFPYQRMSFGQFFPVLLLNFWSLLDHSPHTNR